MVNNTPKISIIVPVYNAEPYLIRCIDSILSQTFTDFELLLVDDGSTDNSGKICNEYVAKDNRIWVYHKKNGGASSARNLGIEESKGEYICFVDSDDWVEDKYLSDFLLEQFKNEKLLVIQTCIYYEYLIEPHRSDWHSINYNNSFYFGPDIVNALSLSDFFVSADGGPVGKLFQKKIIDKYNIRFSDNISAYEDVIFCLKYISKIDSLYISKGKNYHYMHRDSHTSLSKRKLAYHEYLYSANEGETALNEIFKKFNINNLELINHSKIVMMRISMASIYALYSSNYIPSYKERISLLKLLKNKNKNLIQKRKEKTDKKGRIINWLFSRNPAIILDMLFITFFKVNSFLKK